MANCAQQLTWHLKRADLEKMLNEAGGNYSALEFKLCVSPTAQTQYFMSLISVNTSAASTCTDMVKPVGNDQEVCPVPPDCNKDAEKFRFVLKKFYDENSIVFKIDQQTFIDAFK